MGEEFAFFLKAPTVEILQTEAYTAVGHLKLSENKM